MNTSSTQSTVSFVEFANTQRRTAGFTLTELVITVAIAAILAALAAPSFSSLIASQRMKNVATDIYLALAKARSEAIKRDTNVTLSPNTGGWAAGWEILDPADATGTTKIEDHEAISNTAISGPTSVIYRSSGRVSGTSAPKFDITATGSTSHTCVTVDLSGLPTQSTSSSAC